MAQHHTSIEQGYEVQHRDNCMLVFGLVPLRETASLLAQAGAEDQMDIHLTSLTGAAMVIGHPDNLAILRQRNDLPINPKRQQQHDEALEHGYSQAFANWLLKGERGTSSDYMAHKATGFPAEATVSHPRDIDDLQRCIGFIKAVAGDLTPDSVLARMADSPAPWPHLAQHWPLLITAENPVDPHQAQRILDDVIYGDAPAGTDTPQS